MKITLIAARGSKVRLVRGLAVAGLCWLLLAGLHLAGAFRIFDLRLLDMHFAWRGQHTTSAPIALVEVDDATIDAYGDWPLPRSAYALLLVALQESGARAIGVDFLFRGGDDWDPQNDSLLAAVTSEVPMVVHSVAFPAGDGEMPAPEPAALSRLDLVSLPAPATLPLVVANAISLPFDALLEKAGALGHISVAVDPDGGIRRVPLVVEYRGRVIPSLGLRLAGLSHGELKEARVHATGHRVTVHWKDGAESTFPVDGEGATRIDFMGGRGSFGNRHSMLSVLQLYRNGEMDRLRDWFGSQVVLIGSTAIGEGVTDMGATPFDVATPLVYVHANVLRSALDNQYLYEPSPWASLSALLVVALVLGALFALLNLPIAAGVMIVAAGLMVFLEHWCFARWRLVVPQTISFLLPPFCYAAMASYRFAVLERWQRWRDKELGLARAIQQRLLPKHAPQIEGYDIHGINIPAQEVGGDYFDWVVLPGGKLLVALGDVSGKGVAASLLMAHLRASFQAEARGKAEASRIMDSMHISLLHAVELGHFATFFLAIIPLEGNELIYSNAGHNPALLLHDGSMDLLTNSGPPLAILEIAEYGEEVRKFEGGDVLVVYSDGVTESPVGNDEYGEERLQNVVRQAVASGKSARGIVDAILTDVRRVAGELRGWDDITLVVVRKKKIERG